MRFPSVKYHLKISLAINYYVYKGKHELKIIYFEECGPGYSGPNCTLICTYPTYGDECQEICDCDNKTCDISTGCRIPTTGILICSKIMIK